jgi:hypothetical protein
MVTLPRLERAPNSSRCDCQPTPGTDPRIAGQFFMSADNDKGPGAEPKEGGRSLGKDRPLRTREGEGEVPGVRTSF